MVGHMRVFWVLSAALFLSACGLPAQALTSPCVGKPATAPLGECPSCATDSDCKTISNQCEPSAYCVHKDSSFQVNAARTCRADEMYPATPFLCKCLGNICDWHR
jgi:hypothetical protein